jgi:uncharacterized membrane protein YcfT
VAVPAAPPARHAWVDAGRGLAIVLVVLLHARDWLAEDGLDMTAWGTVTELVSGIRMPLFFTVSGLLGAGWVRAGWPRLLSRKITLLVWVYLLWQPIGLLASLLADRITGYRPTVAHLLVSLAATTVRPRSELWFLWALAAYFVLARCSRRVPVPAQLMVAGAVSLLWLSGYGPAGNLGWDGVPKYYLFFLVGAHFREPVLRFARTWARHRRVGAALVIGWLAVAVPTLLAGRHVIGPGLVSQLLGLAAGIAIAVRLTRWRVFSYLGSRTLPIYLGHTPLIIVLAWLLHTRVGQPWAGELAPALPVLITALVVPGTLLLERALAATPGRILYAPPEPVTAWVRQRCTR